MAGTDQSSAEMTEDYSSTVIDGQMLDEIAALEELMALNITNENELNCLYNFLKEPYPPFPVPVGTDPISAFCNSTWDGVSCWPTTLAGTTSVLPCVEELDGIKYDTASKLILSVLLLLSAQRNGVGPSFIRSGGCGFDSLLCVQPRRDQVWLFFHPLFYQSKNKARPDFALSGQQDGLRSDNQSVVE